MQPHHRAHFTSRIEVADFLKNNLTYSTIHRDLHIRKGLPLIHPTYFVPRPLTSVFYLRNFRIGLPFVKPRFTLRRSWYYTLKQIGFL